MALPLSHLGNDKVTATPSAEEDIYLGKKDGSPIKVCCNTCPYFTNRIRLNSGSEGICRRNAPVPSVSNRASWPAVYASDWCGEHPAFIK